LRRGIFIGTASISFGESGICITMPPDIILAPGGRRADDLTIEMNRSIEQKISIGFAAALCLLAIIALASFRSIRHFVANSRWEDHTHQVLAAISGVALQIKDAEAGGRDYVISGDEHFVLTEDAAAAQVASGLRELRELTSDNSHQQERLNRLEILFRQKSAFIAHVSTIRKEQGFAPAQQLILTPDNKSLTEQLDRLLEEMRAEENELLKTRSAAEVTSARLTTVVISGGSLLAILFVSAAAFLIRRDITRRRQAEDELGQFFTLSLDMLCIAGTDGHFKRVSPVWMRTLGFSEQQLLCTPYIQLVHPDDRAATVAEASKLARGEMSVSFENRFRCTDGSYRWLMWTAAPAPSGSVIYAAARDITDRKKVEQALQLAEERYRLLIESVHDYAIYMLDTSGHVASWNSGAQRIKGYTAEEMIGQHFSRFYRPEDLKQGKPARELQLATENGRYEEEGWRVCKDGSEFWANVVITAVHDDAGQLRGFAKITRNMTERKRAEDDIRNLNHRLQQHATQLEAANRELEAFCYSVSHDLRAPLRGIDGFSMALLEDYGDTLKPEARDYLQRVRAGTQRMAQLIDDLLNLSRITRTELRRSPVDLSAVARAAATDLKQAQPERTVEFTIADGLHVDGDPRLLRVVFDNLFGNAWKFTAKRPDAKIEFGAAGQNGRRHFFVRDNGAGFDMTYVHKLFGAFQRLHAASEYSGTGVGLATVQRIIHRHGGTVSAQGEVDNGATFSFTL
jgi:PAS domain S-box-containing protein